MYEDCPARLVMKRSILTDGRMDEASRMCKVISYDPDEGDLYLLIGKTGLSRFSLDGLYECSLTENGESLTCTGLLKERYATRGGKMVVFHIQNGFYKNIVN